MARAVRKKELTAEERLAAALVPEEEQPYKVPGNWCWVRLLDTFYNLTDSKRKIQQKNYLESGSIAVVDQGQEIVGGYTDDEDMLFMGELPVIVFGDHTRCIKYVDFPFAQGADGVKVLAPKKCYETRAFYYALQNVNIPNMGYRRHYPLFKEYFIPLPPLPEQQRIVTLIESLFADLDEAKEKLTAVMEGFAQRKAAILHQAFTGELTARWREENNLSSELWKKRRLGELGTLERGKSKHRPRNDPKLFGGPYPFVQTGDISSAGMYLTAHKQTLSEVGLQQSKLFPAGTLCITIAANIGDVSILSYDCCFPDSVVGFTPNENSLSEYIYYMMTTIQKELEANAPATAQKNINLKVLNDTYVSVPTIDEQREIVRILDDLFEQEQQAQSAVETVLADIDTLKKSILARAFRGELSTNDPKEENAVGMLKKVLCDLGGEN